MSESGLPLDHGGMIDRWQRIWVPHREAYLRGEGRPAHDGPGEECPFCRAPGMAEDEGLLVHTGLVSVQLQTPGASGAPQPDTAPQPTADTPVDGGMTP